MRRLLPLLGCLLLSNAACRADQATRDPESLREALLAAERNDDPDAAYDLLSPKMQAEVSLEEFRKAWRDEKRFRSTETPEASAKPDPGPHVGPMRGTSKHDELTLVWEESPEGFRVVAGFPETLDARTPEQLLLQLAQVLESDQNPSWAALAASESASMEAERRQRLAQHLTASARDPSRLAYSADGLEVAVSLPPELGLRQLVMRNDASRWVLVRME